MDISSTIPLSATDTELRRRGYDLLGDYAHIIQAAGFDPALPVLDPATGPGRAASILNRLGYRVVCGDISMDRTSDVKARVTTPYAHLVSFCQLTMEHLPFRNDAVHSILCLNTIHELSDPWRCMEELIRVHQPSGTCVISDFTEEGFDLLQEIHLEIYGKDHFRSAVGLKDIIPGFSSMYAEIDRVDTPLNTTYMFRKKRI